MTIAEKMADDYVGEPRLPSKIGGSIKEAIHEVINSMGDAYRAQWLRYALERVISAVADMGIEKAIDAIGECEHDIEYGPHGVQLCKCYVDDAVDAVCNHKWWLEDAEE